MAGLAFAGRYVAWLSGLDPASVRRVEELLVGASRRYGPTTILTSHHIPSTLRIADHVVVLAEGRAIQGTAAEVRRSEHPVVAGFFTEVPEPAS